MDIEINEVQEIIKNLKSGGELSIKEEKYLNVAKLCVQMAEENVALSKDAQRYRFIRERDMFGSDNEPGLLSWEELTELECKEFDDAVDARINHPSTGFIELDAKLQARETTATDRIVAGIKADGVEEFSKTLEGAADICGKSKAWEAQENLLDFAERGFAFAKQLREGADK